MPTAKQTKSGPLRKSHTKSRKGCLQCKQKHVKCNEEHPRCSNCERLDINCIYPSVRGAKSHSNSPNAVVSAAISHVPFQEGPWNQPLAMDDLELLHNYTHNNVFQVSRRKEVMDILSDRYVRLGFTSPYILHSILAISALQMFSKDRSRKDLFARASSLQNVALTKAQSYIASMSSKHSIGLFVFSSFTATFALAEVILNPHDPAELRDPIEDITNCFQLTRGIATVNAPFWAELQTSWIAPVLQDDDHRDETVPDLEQKFPVMITLRSLALQQESEERRQAGVEAIDKMFLYIALSMTYPEGHYCYRLILLWPIELARPFLDMLDERDPFALVLLAYYAVLMQQMEEVWYLSGWPRLLVGHLGSILGEEWDDLLRWPREVALPVLPMTSGAAESS